MAVTTLSTGRRYSGLSTDDKPVRLGTTATASAVPAGSTFYETDTGRTFSFDAGRWWLVPDSASTSAVEQLLAEQNVLLRGIRFGLTALSGVDLSEIN